LGLKSASAFGLVTTPLALCPGRILGFPRYHDGIHPGTVALRFPFPSNVTRPPRPIETFL